MSKCKIYATKTLLALFFGFMLPAIALGQPCTGSPAPGTINATPASDCSLPFPSTLIGTGLSTGVGIGYQWQSSSDSSVWSDVLGATDANYDATVVSTVIYYRLNTTCALSSTAVSSAGVRLFQIPATSAGTIGGITAFCQGTSSTLTETVSGGTWSSSDPSVATIDAATGVCNGLAGGTTVISYTVTGACGDAVATQLVRITGYPALSPIAGTTRLCTGTSTTMSDTATAGTWSSSNTSVATISSSGVVTAVGVGNATISYTKTNVCGTTTVTVIDTVESPLTSGSISGSTPICVGTSAIYFETVSGGTWSSTNPSVATINPSTAILTALTGGSTTLSYTQSNSCGTIADTRTITVDTNAFAGVLSGGSVVCPGVSFPVSSTVGGGTWSSSATAVATVDATGNVFGVTAGTAVISYSFTNSCGTAYSMDTVTVNPSPSAGTLSGTTTLCTGTTTTLTSTVTGGSWTTGTTAIATVSSTGVVGGVTAGSTNISYSVTNSCGTATTSIPVTVNTTPSAGSISGLTAICVGTTTTMVDGVSGGTWRSSNTTVATISSTGSVRALAVGTTTISYLVTTACGIGVAVLNVTVTPTTPAGTISGTTSLCVGSTSTLTSTVTGGTWISSAPSVATINSSTGMVRGASAGTATISYLVSGTCGTGYAFATVNVASSPTSGTISGTSTVCASVLDTLTSTVAGGTWSSSATSVATVSSTGVVTAVSGGTATITYSVAYSCGTATSTFGITVNPAPDAGTISGLSAVCVMSTTSLVETSTTGTWSSSDPTKATVSSTGVVSGVATGSVTISYTATNSCGTAVTTHAMTVNAGSGVSALTGGASAICAGSTTAFATTTTGGAWSSSNTSVATVDASGSVYAVAAGTTNIAYTVSSSCGSASASAALTVNPLPSVGTITGPSVVCISSGATALTDTAARGGSWTSSNNTLATVSSTGVVTPINVGNVIISYSATNSCGTLVATHAITIATSPTAGTISGLSSVCLGGSTTLSSTIAGGTWSSSSTSTATVGATGDVHGIASGSFNITYTVSSSCGTATAVYSMSVVSGVSAGAISGTSSFCQGATVTLSATVSGGTWSSSASSVASVDSIGRVFGASAGSATISYTVTSGCGTAIAMQSVTVNAAPVAGTLSGSSSICAGASTTLTASVTGGTWSSSNVGVATVSAAGVVTGVTGGSATISYSVTNSCGTAVATHSMTINPSPYAGFISGSTTTCVSGTTTLVDTLATGTIAWTSGDASIATVSSTGVVTGVAAGSVTITLTATNGCGTAAATTVVNVTSGASAGTLSGIDTMCSGTSTTLATTVSGGTWSSTNPSVATVNSTGDVTAISGGAVTISYSVTGACGTASTSKLMYVFASPDAGTISGTSIICPGTTTTLSETVTGGTWSSTNTSVATISATGVVSGVAAGASTIQYLVTGTHGCNSIATFPVTVSASLPTATLTPANATLCTGMVAITVSVTGVNYQWFSGATVLSGATNATFYATLPGVYHVVISNTCTSDTVGNSTIVAAPTPVVSVAGPLTLTTGTFASYQWFKDGVAIPGATHQSYVYSSNGTYSVRVTDANGCAVMSAGRVVGTSGITNINGTSEFNIFPNPATNMVHIEAGQEVRVEVVTAVGTKVKAASGTDVIDISDLADGMYVFMLFDNNNNLVHTARIVKQN